MNSISGVRRALAYEVRRQTEALERGEDLEQETRGWDDGAGETFLMRTKEFAHDYRYFPDPDLVPVRTEALVREARSRLPELPRAKRARFVEEYGVSAYDAGVLANDLALAGYFEAAAKGARKPKSVANWILNDLQSALANSGRSIGECPVPPGALEELVNLVEAGTISGKQAKEVFAEMFASGKTRRRIVKEKGIEQLSDAGGDRSAVRSGHRGESEAGGRFQSGKCGLAEFSQGPGDKAVEGNGEPRVGGRDFGAQAEANCRAFL